ncbi:hypothetical protein D3C72_973960 [compost metagenome]
MAEAAVVVKFHGVGRGVGRHIFSDIGEGTAVAEQRQICELGTVEPQELSSPYAPETHRLGVGVFALHRSVADDAARHQHPMIGRIAEDLMRIGVVPIGFAAGRIAIVDEVVAGIDEIEAVGEYEFHRFGLESSRSSLRRYSLKPLICLGVA